MKSLIALPVLALLTLACGGEEHMKKDSPSNERNTVSMQSIIESHSASLTDKQIELIDGEISKVVSKMKAKEEVPESCYNAIQSPLKALYTSTMAKDDKSIKLAKEEVNKVTNDVELCGEIAEYNQAAAKVGVQNTPGGTGAYPANGVGNPQGGYPQGGYPQGGYPQGGYPQGGEVIVGGEIGGGGLIGPDLLGIGYWFGSNITNSIITIVEASKYCDTSGILFGSSALTGTFTGPTLVNGILDALGMYFFYAERLRPQNLPDRCYPDNGYPGGDYPPVDPLLGAYPGNTPGGYPLGG